MAKVSVRKIRFTAAGIPVPGIRRSRMMGKAASTS